MSAKKATILIVEDSPDQARLLRQRLEGAGFEVIATCDGAEALAAARRYHPDAVVTDIKMPVMDGYALCRAIRQEEAFKLTPVILLTALSDPLDVINAVNAGADAYVSKPYDVPALVSRIESLIAHPTEPAPPLERRKVSVHLDGRTHMVDAHGPRMLNLLMSAYENAVIQNRHLIAAQQALEDFNQHLGQKISEKTAALQQSETQLNNALKVGRMAHWEYDVVADRFTFNDNLYAIYHTTAADEGGYSMSSADYTGRFVHADDLPIVQEAIRVGIESPASDFSYELEHRILYADGGTGYVYVRFIRYKDARGRTVKTFGVNQDITERKRAEREAEFKSTVILTQQETSPDAILLVADDARILSYNRRFIDLWGLPEDLVREGKDGPVLQWVVRQVDDPDAFLAKIRDVYDDHGAKLHDEVETKDGRIVDRYSAPVVGPNGKYYGRVWYFRDVTQRVRAEQTIRDSEAKFRGAVDQSPVGIVIVRDGAFIYANPTVRRTFGYTADEFARLSPAELVVEADRQRLSGDMRLLETGGAPAIHDTYRGLCKDGTMIDVEAHGTGIELGGKPALTAILVDVTESRRARRQVEESEAKLKAIFEAATDGIAVADPVTRKIDSFNTGFCRLLGYGPEEIGHLHADDLHPAEIRLEVMEQFQRQARGESKGGTDVPMKRKDGSVFFADISTATTTLGDKLRLVGVFHDVTQRKRDEEALRKVNRALKTLSAGNEALLHAADEPALLDAMCRAIVDVGGYHTAWVGYARPDPARSVELVACDGADAANMRRLRLSWADDEFGRGATGTAIREGESCLLRGLKSESRLAPWHTIMADSSATSSLALPLRANGGPPFGALGIMAAETDAFDEEECRLLEELSRDLSFGIIALRTRDERRAGAEKLRKGLEDSIQAIAATVEMRDPYTGGHERRVAQLAEAIATEMGLDKDRIHGLHLAGIVHDVGKISVPAEILSKPGRLSEIELSLVKVHPQSGYEILKNVEFPWPIAQMVLQHHERIDGSGYPQGLKGEEILLEARILAVADTVEAMSSHRPYRAGLGIEKALGEIEKGSGRLYDSDVVRTCIRLFRDKGYQIQT